MKANSRITTVGRIPHCEEIQFVGHLSQPSHLEIIMEWDQNNQIIIIWNNGIYGLWTNGNILYVSQRQVQYIMV